jgi:hypothetical protein
MLRKRKESNWKGTAAVVVLFSSCLLMLPRAQEVNAHSWYPVRCCGGQDCRKVDKIDFLPDGGMVMHVGYMEVVVPSKFPKQPSQDANAHVCVSIATGTYVPVCVFMPGTA